MQDLIERVKCYKSIIKLDHSNHKYNTEIYQLCSKIVDGDKWTIKKCQKIAKQIADEEKIENTLKYLNVVALYTLATILELKIK